MLVPAVSVAAFAGDCTGAFDEKAFVSFDESIIFVKSEIQKFLGSDEAIEDSTESEAEAMQSAADATEYVIDSTDSNKDPCECRTDTTDFIIDSLEYTMNSIEYIM